MPTIHTNGVQTFYQDDDFSDGWNESEAIWIQHGFGRNSNFWSHWVPPLADRYRVLRRDLRAHGRSSDPGPDYFWSVDDLLNDMTSFIDSLGLERVHYVGESVGGILGVAFAARWPERIKSLTLCATPTAIHSRTQKIFSLQYEDWEHALSSLGSGGWGKAMMDLGDGLSSAPPEYVDWVCRQWAMTPTHALKGFSRLAREVDITSLLPQIKVPTLVLAPTHSPFTSPAEQAAIGAAIPGSRLESIAARGHEIYADNPSACIGALLEFLAPLSVEAS